MAFAKFFHRRARGSDVYICAGCAKSSRAPPFTRIMPLKVKDALRATVHLTFDGRVIKAYHGPKAGERFAQETKILKFLERRGCTFVPRLLEADPERVRIVTTNCGSRVEHLDDYRRDEIFAELEK